MSPQRSRLFSYRLHASAELPINVHAGGREYDL